MVRVMTVVLMVLTLVAITMIVADIEACHHLQSDKKKEAYFKQIACKKRMLWSEKKELENI